MKKQMRLLITGAPCTGKTTMAKQLSSHLDCALVSANDLATQLGCYKIGKKGVKEVDLKVLQKHLKKLLDQFGNRKESVVVEGHLLSDMKLPCEKMLVLRCNPLVLEKRMRARKWSKEKIAENLLAEMLDYCQINSEKNYGKRVVQLDFTKPLSVGKTLEKLLKNASQKVEWSGLLLSKKFAGRYVF